LKTELDMCKAGPTSDASWIIQVTCEAKAEAEVVLFLSPPGILSVALLAREMYKYSA
jgi:hypothetical protein